MDKSPSTSLSERLGNLPKTLFIHLQQACDAAINVAKAHTLLPTPRIGAYWPEEGGVYAGVIRDGDRQWHLILATEPKSIFNNAWGSYGASEPGACSYVDGLANTTALLDSSNSHPFVDDLAKYNKKGKDGHKDFYLPAQKEQNLLYINLPEHLGKTYHWSSTQFSASYAWFQNFENGDHVIGNKGSERAARAVRRLPL